MLPCSSCSFFFFFFGSSLLVRYSLQDKESKVRDFETPSIWRNIRDVYMYIHVRLKSNLQNNMHVTAACFI